MSYQSLYRKYRSQTFADLVGQDAITRALQGAVTAGRVAHAYLFSGSRGTGKTSTARLLAKTLNCTGRGSSPEPCGVCSVCVDVQSGAFLDLIEIDAASNRGIEDVRDLRDKVRLAPAVGPFKIYILDEAHMLSNEAFNALLKTLEEPPEHVVFVLCTTDAQKLPLTVIGRCQQFVFRRHTDDVIGTRLAHIAAEEGFEVESEALGLIARLAEGSMRDAIGFLDQLVPLANGRIGVESARQLLGVADPRQVAQLFDAVLAGHPRLALEALGELYGGGVELRPLVRALIEQCRDRLVASIEARDSATRVHLSMAMDALLHLDGEVRRHAEPRLLVEATLVRIAVAAGAEPAAASAPRVQAAPALNPGSVVPLARPVSAVPARAAAPEEPSAGVVTPGPTSAPVAEPVPVSDPTADPQGDVPISAPDGAGRTDSRSVGAPQTPRGTTADAPPAVAANAGESDARWAQVLAELPPASRGIFKQGQLELSDKQLVLVYRYPSHLDVAEAKRAQLVEAVATYYGPGFTVGLRLASPDEPPPPRSFRPAAPEAHPMVQAAIDKLDGRVIRVRETHE